ncbi:PLDc N-terminal domain-containing protein [Dactylosporangium sp. CA-139066]|uniref:PLDc N-terminal domain-containing protein n=1 Tax=Dactylosporangium sp. CA-139066 TaxID=3239930 RepID=UPI003D9362E1
MLTLASTGSVPVAAIIPLAVIALGFVAYCLYDLSRSPVRYLPKWVWAIICLVSIPLGGVVYLLVGRDHR